MQPGCWRKRRAGTNLVGVKKLLTFVGLALAAVLGLSFAVGLGTYAAHRDNREKCASPLGASATQALGIELPPGVQVCRKSDRAESSELQLLVESPGPLCFLSAGQLGCPSLPKNQLAFITAMSGAGWDTGDTRDRDQLAFRGDHGASASVLFRVSRYGEIAASMTVYLPSTKIGKDD